MAMAHSPIITSSESPNRTKGRSSASTFSTTTSELRSAPTSVASYSVPFGRCTEISEAPRMTCLFVQTYPSALTTKPDPDHVYRFLYTFGFRRLRSGKNQSNGSMYTRS